LQIDPRNPAAMDDLLPNVGRHQISVHMSAVVPGAATLPPRVPCLTLLVTIAVGSAGIAGNSLPPFDGDYANGFVRGGGGLLGREAFFFFFFFCNFSEIFFNGLF
jgi:hypothetical protein